MTGATPERMAALLAAIRRANRAARATDGHPALAEVLLWIAAGADTVRDVARVSGLSESETRRLVGTLEGRGQRRPDGSVKHSALSLVRRRQHPHNAKALQLLLTTQGKELIASTFDLRGAV